MGLGEGLFDDSFHALVNDGHGFLYMSTNRGIARVLRDDFLAVVEGRARTLLPQVFGVKDGLRSQEANGGIQPSVSVAPDGRLWFATMGGAAVVDPGRIVKNLVPPRVRIMSLVVDGQPLRLTGQPPRWSSRPRRVPSRSASRRSRSACRGGASRSAIDSTASTTRGAKAGTSRLAHYGHVEPGSYTFRVLAINEDGVPSERAAVLSLARRARFRETVWFPFLLVAGAGLLDSPFSGSARRDCCARRPSWRASSPSARKRSRRKRPARGQEGPRGQRTRLRARSSRT